MRGYSFDGKGINGLDEYRRRLATLTHHGHEEGVGELLAAAPVMAEALRQCITSPGAACYKPNASPVERAKALQRRLEAINATAWAALERAGEGDQPAPASD